jgi:hypothetical protein
MKTKFTLVVMAITMNVFAQVPTTGLVGYYPFTGNANDLSGNANNGTVTGATLTTDRFGNTNSAYSFNGTNTYITVPSTTTIASFPNGQTISMWLRVTSYPTNGKENIIIDKRDNSNKYYQVFLSNFTNLNKAVYRFAQSGAVSSQANNINFSSLPLNQWFNLTYTTDLNTTKSYLNGSLMNTFVSASTIGVNTNPLLFGKSNQAFSNDAFYNGLLDDIRIYNRPLDSTEVTALYNEGVCFQMVTVTDTLLIHLNTTGFNPITYANTIKIFPNPASSQITIDCGNFSNINGYKIKILNTLSQMVYQQTINSQTYTVSLNTFGGAGLYFVNIYDANNNLIDVRKIVLQ